MADAETAAAASNSSDALSLTDHSVIKTSQDVDKYLTRGLGAVGRGHLSRAEEISKFLIKFSSVCEGKSAQLLNVYSSRVPVSPEDVDSIRESLLAADTAWMFGQLINFAKELVEDNSELALVALSHYFTRRSLSRGASGEAAQQRRDMQLRPYGCRLWWLSDSWDTKTVERAAARSQYIVGLSFLIVERPMDALRRFSSVIRASPDFLLAPLDRACAYEVMCDFAAGRKDVALFYRVYQRCYPDGKPLPRPLIAIAQNLQGIFFEPAHGVALTPRALKQAYEMYTKAIMDDKTILSSHLNRARLYIREAREASSTQLAVESATNALVDLRYVAKTTGAAVSVEELKPEFTEPRRKNMLPTALLFGDAHLAAGRYDKAMQWYAQILRFERSSVNGVECLTTKGLCWDLCSGVAEAVLRRLARLHYEWGEAFNHWARSQAIRCEESDSSTDSNVMVCVASCLGVCKEALRWFPNNAFFRTKVVDANRLRSRPDLRVRELRDLVATNIATLCTAPSGAKNGNRPPPPPLEQAFVRAMIEESARQNDDAVAVTPVVTIGNES